MKKLNILLILVLLNIAVHAQVELASFTANVRNRAVELNWSALNERGMYRHEIEKSYNGRAFNPVGHIPAQNNGTAYQYQFTDAAPNEGSNYYRIKTISATGAITYSHVLQVNTGYYRTDFRVIPNPIRNGVINLQLENIAKGKYVVQVFSANGQPMLNQTFDHPGGSSTQILELPAGVARGVYVMNITNGIVRTNQRIVVD